MSDPFKGNMDDVMNGLFGKERPTPAKDEQGVPWEAKVIDGKYYIPLSQVYDLLLANDVLPKVRAGIRRRVQKGPPPFSQKAGHENTNDR
jgi:hypothetical protein